MQTEDTARFLLLIRKSPTYFLGSDVGTGSTQAGLFGARGRRATSAAWPIRMWKLAPKHVEQCSDDIWRACGADTHATLKSTDQGLDSVGDIGFDAAGRIVAPARVVVARYHTAKYKVFHQLHGTFHAGRKIMQNF